MTNSIKTAFSQICAEQQLKQNTLAYIDSQLQKRTNAKSVVVGRIASALCCCALIAVPAFVLHSMYFTANAFVDLDINPSVELAVNRFDRVIDVYTYDSDGGEAVSGAELRHKLYKEALATLISSYEQKGMLQGDGWVSVTLAAKEREEERLADIREWVVPMVTVHSGEARVEVFPVSAQTKIQAHEQDVSPAKYLAILDLMNVDPNTTFEGCKGHTVKEIKQLASSDGTGHHEKHQGASPAPQENDAGDNSPAWQEPNGHHNRAKKGRHGH